MPNDISEKIGAIVVLYNPDFKELFESLRLLVPQVDIVCLIDNSPNDNRKFFDKFDKVFYKPLFANLGIAKAQNIGIDYLNEIGCNYVIFSDQDSQISEHAIDRLLTAYKALVRDGVTVGVVGTKAINKQTQKAYPPKSKLIGRWEIVTSYGEKIDITEFYSVISSISLISLYNIMKVGGFEESLFIDGVDHEWCWRAWHYHGLRSFVVEDALLYHQLGEGDRHIVGKNVAISSSTRLYYQYRNYLILCRRNYVPLYWKKKNGLKYLVKFFYYPLFVKPKLKNLRNILRGIKDGCNMMC